MPMRSKNAALGPPTNVDEYLERVPEPGRGTLEKIRAVIRANAPKETTEGISYQVPAYKYKGMLIGFAAFSDHCSLLVMNPSVISGFTEELKKYTTSKGTIQFPLDKPLPASLLKKIIKARVAQNDAKKSAKS